MTIPSARSSMVWAGLVLLGALARCATSPDLEPGQAYLLSRMGYTPGYQISGIELRNVDTGDNVVVKPGRAVLTRAAPGRYYVRRIRYEADNVYGDPLPQPEALIPVEASKINYIGSFAIIVAAETDSRFMLAPQHDYPKQVVEEGRTAFKGAFALYPLVEARARFDPETAAVGSERP